MSLPPPPPRKKPLYVPEMTVTNGGKLDEGETHFILASTLSPQHHDDPNVLRFIQAYLKCRNQAQAAREAGLPSSAGRSLRAKPDIHAAIAKLTARSLDKYGYDAAEIVERVKEFLDVDPVELEGPDGQYKERMSDIAPEVRRAIKKMVVKNEYEQDPNGMKFVCARIISIEFHDKLKSSELLGREKDLFKEVSVKKHDVTENMAAALLATPHCDNVAIP